MADITVDDIDRANRRIKSLKVSLKAKNGKLWLQVTLPPRPGSKNSQWHQQNLTTKQPLTKVGLKSAIAIARQVDAQLTGGTFEWSQ